MWIQLVIFAIVAVVSDSRVIRSSPKTLNNYVGFHDFKTTDIKDIIDLLYLMNLQKELNWLNAVYEPNYVFNFPFESTIVDSRTMNDQKISDPMNVATTPELTTNVGNELEQPNGYRVSIVDSRTVNQHPTNDIFGNEPAPEIKYPFKVGIVDPRTVDKSGSSNTNSVESKSPLPTSVGNAHGPIIRYPFRVGIVDPRTEMKPTSKNTFDNEPAPGIKQRF